MLYALVLVWVLGNDSDGSGVRKMMSVVEDRDLMYIRLPLFPPVEDVI